MISTPSIDSSVPGGIPGFFLNLNQNIMKQTILKPLMVLVFALMINFGAKAQNFFDLNVTNTQTCDIVVEVLDNSIPATVLATVTVPAGSTVNLTCISGRPFHLKLSDPNNASCFFHVAPNALTTNCITATGNPAQCCGCIGSISSASASQTSGTPPPSCNGGIGTLYTQNLSF